MHVRIRMFGKSDTIVVVESKLTKIEQLRNIIEEKFDVPSTLQCLFYGGKLLENGYTIHDYNIKLNDVIQLLAKVQPDEKSVEEKTPEKREEKNEHMSDNKDTKYIDAMSTLYTIGDLIDVKDSINGSWLEGKIERIVFKSGAEVDAGAVTSTAGLNEQNDNKENDVASTSERVNRETSKSRRRFITPNTSCQKVTINNTEENLLFKVQIDDEALYYKYTELRPRARTEVNVKDLTTGQTVMINYNPEHPLQKGHWYDFKIDKVVKLRKGYELLGTLFIGQDDIPQNHITVRVLDKIFLIETVVPLSERTEEYKKIINTSPAKRSLPLNCVTCSDNIDLPCRDCGCYLCSGKEEPENILLCDECNNGFHMKCLSPSVTEIPSGDWYCPSCKRDSTDVVAPGAAQQSKKASTSKSSRDWGRGMACVGKTKTCAMPANHFGPIPGIEVGMCWRFRIQLSESGVHRPPVSGIHGRDVEGAYSIVLSGGYEDDVDHGYEFTYTGSGGRDLSGNKRTAEQSCDQTLSRENKALARNCAVKLDEAGADAGADWRQGKPVRVVRSYKMLKHFPEYAPKEGIRYDGIYKVVKYYPEKGLSGYRVWKYLLRRDDPSPAPWEVDAKQYPIIYPDGYLEAEVEKKALKEKKNSISSKGRNKRTLYESNQLTEIEMPLSKKRKIEDNVQTRLGIKRSHRNSKRLSTIYEGPRNYFAKVCSIDEIQQRNNTILTPDVIAVIKADTANAKLWDECLEVSENMSKQEFIEHVRQVFLCIICREVAVNPVTTPCSHNFCLGCIKTALKSSESQTCPCCRHSLNMEDLEQNEKLKAALQAILVGYDAGKK